MTELFRRADNAADVLIQYRKIAGTRGKMETHVMAMTKTYYIPRWSGLEGTVLFAEQ
jgi:hypothetical protein